MNTQTVVSVGIDVGKAKLDVACMRPDKSMVHQVFNNNPKGISSLKSFLKQQRTAATVPCTLESTGRYHFLVSLSLIEAGYTVNCVNPIITKKYMKATIRDAKSDKIDCKRIAELGYNEPNLQKFTTTRPQIAAKSILSSLSQLEHVRQKLVAHIDHIEEMQETLGIKIDHKAMAKAVAQLDAQIDAHRASLCALAPEEARHLAQHTPGLSEEHAAALFIALSDKQFENRDQLVAFVGLDVKTRQSGSWQGKQVLSKRGNGYLRKVLFQVGWGLKMHHPLYKTYFESLRARGKGYRTAVIAVARKFLRFLFAYFWKKSVTLVPVKSIASTVAVRGAVLSPLSTV
jgi:transposase